MELLRFLHNEADVDGRRGSPAKVLASIDEYARTQKYLMNVGPDKGKIVTDLIAEVKPETMVELGGYVGYSTVLFGDAVRRSGGRRYLSLERSPVFAAVVMAVVHLAGLSDFVSVVVGPSDASLRRLHNEGVIETIDLLFLDHSKPMYTRDLMLCEELRLIKPESVLAADNVIAPGNPPYLEYVRSSVQKKRQRYEGITSNGNAHRHTENSSDQSKDQVAEWDSEASLPPATEAKGNPNLVYESKLHEGFEPSGDPVGSPPLK